MKGVILAGGRGTRLKPITNYMNKHMIPVGSYPMIYYSIQKMKNAGITDLMLVTGKQSAGLFIEYLGNGHEYGVRLTYKIQEQAGGIAEALLMAEDFVRENEKLLVILGDNLFEDELLEAVTDFQGTSGQAMVFIKEVEDPGRYGVPILKEERIERIIEKPFDPPSNYSVTGIYLYDTAVFDIIKGVQPSARGEMEITDVNNVYAEQGTLSYRILTGWWTDAGTFPSLMSATRNLSNGGFDPV